MFQPVQTPPFSFSQLPSKHQGSTVRSQRDWTHQTRPPGDDDDDDDDSDVSVESLSVTFIWLISKSGRESLCCSATVLEAIQRKSLFVTNGLKGVIPTLLHRLQLPHLCSALQWEQGHTEGYGGGKSSISHRLDNNQAALSGKVEGVEVDWVFGRRRFPP